MNSRLPVKEGLIACHPVPLPHNSIIDRPISHEWAGRIIGIKAGYRERVTPVLVLIVSTICKRAKG